MKYTVFILAVSVLSIILATPVVKTGYSEDPVFEDPIFDDTVYDVPSAADQDLDQNDAQAYERLARAAGTPRNCNAYCRQELGRVAGVCKLLRNAIGVSNESVRLCGPSKICICSVN